LHVRSVARWTRNGTLYLCAAASVDTNKHTHRTVKHSTHAHALMEREMHLRVPRHTYSSMRFPAQWAVIDELDFMKQEIPRWNEVLRRETEARRAVSCRQTEGNRTKTPCIHASTKTWSHARMHAHSEFLEERWRDGTGREGREGPRVCMHVAHSNSNAHMHENTRTHA